MEHGCDCVLSCRTRAGYAFGIEFQYFLNTLGCFGRSQGKNVRKHKNPAKLDGIYPFGSDGGRALLRILFTLSRPSERGGDAIFHWGKSNVIVFPGASGHYPPLASIFGRTQLRRSSRRAATSPLKSNAYRLVEQVVRNTSSHLHLAREW
jgi:hypothetical protein